jgi:hypothetical protein
MFEAITRKPNIHSIQNLLPDGPHYNRQIVDRFKGATERAKGHVALVMHPFFAYPDLLVDGPINYSSLFKMADGSAKKLTQKDYKEYLGRLLGFISNTKMPIFLLHGESNPFGSIPFSNYADHYFNKKLCALVQTNEDIVPKIRIEENRYDGWNTFAGILARIGAKEICLMGELLFGDKGRNSGCVQEPIIYLSPRFTIALKENKCFPGSKKWVQG